MADPLLIPAFRAVAHPWLCDQMGHLTTRHYSGMFDDASYHLFHTLFGYAPGTSAWAGLGWADVQQQFNYLAEIHAGELLAITGQLHKLGTKSVTTRYEMRRLGNGEIAATYDAVTVFFDLQARRAAPLSEAMRARALPYLSTQE